VFEAFVITLREGIEAALVIAIALSLLAKRGLSHKSGAIWGGAGFALVLSIGVAVLAARVTWNQDAAEGVAELGGAVLVCALVWWMWRAAPRVKDEIAHGLDRATGTGGASSAGLFVFAFVMVFREGVETAIFLSAAGFNSQGLARWTGALAGLALAATFGVLFARGTLKVPLKPFFSLTSAVLTLVGVQLLVGGLHELSESQWLPSSRVEMALVGPLVKNELLLFTLTVAIAAGWLLFGPGRTSPTPATTTDGPEARLARARRGRDLSRRRWTGIVATVVVGFLASAFVRDARTPGRAPAEPLTFAGGKASFDAARVKDGKLHFYETRVPGAPEPVRFFAIDVNGEIRTCFDACVICGAKGYYQDGNQVVCRNCTSPIVLTSLGKKGGCNPIPLPHVESGGRIVVDQATIAAALPRLKGH